MNEIGAKQINCPGGTIYTVRPGDTLFLIARKFGITLSTLIAANPQIADPSRLTVGQQICIPVRPAPEECPGITYVIQSGDTLYELARRYGTTVDQILRYNPGIDPQRLMIGQRICIPAAVPPIRGKRCLVLNPTDLTPESDGVALLDYEQRSVLGSVANVPPPSVFDLDAYKLWLRRRGTENWDVAEMYSTPLGVWVGLLTTPQPLELYDYITISAEEAENNTRPMGVGVAIGELPPR